MILKNNLDNSRCVNFGNTRAASKDLKRLAKKAAELCDTLSRDVYQSNGATLTISQRRTKTPVPAIQIAKLYKEDCQQVVLDVAKVQNKHWFRLTIRPLQENLRAKVCQFLMNESGTLEDISYAAPITKKMNAAFEKYVPRLLKEFMNLIK